MRFSPAGSKDQSIDARLNLIQLAKLARKPLSPKWTSATTSTCSIVGELNGYRSRDEDFYCLFFDCLHPFAETLGIKERSAHIGLLIEPSSVRHALSQALEARSCASSSATGSSRLGERSLNRRVRAGQAVAVATSLSQ